MKLEEIITELKLAIWQEAFAGDEELEDTELQNRAIEYYGYYKNRIYELKLEIWQLAYAGGEELTDEECHLRAIDKFESIIKKLYQNPSVALTTLSRYDRQKTLESMGPKR